MLDAKQGNALYSGNEVDRLFGQMRSTGQHADDLEHAHGVNES